MAKSPKTGTPHLIEKDGVRAFRMQVPADLWPYFPREIYKSLHRFAKKGDAVNYVEEQNRKWADTFARVREMIAKRDAPALIRQRAEKMKIDLDSTVAQLLDPTTVPDVESAALGKLSGLMRAQADATVAALFDSLVGNDTPEVVSLTEDGHDIGHKHTRDAIKGVLGDVFFALRERRNLPAPATTAELANMPDHVALARMKSDAMDSLYAASLDAEIRQSAPVLEAAGITLEADAADPLALDKLVKEWLEETKATRQESSTHQHRLNMDRFKRSQGNPSLTDPDLYEAGKRYVVERIGEGKAIPTIEKDIATLELFGEWIRARYSRVLPGNANPFAGLLKDARKHLLPAHGKRTAVADQKHSFRPSQVSAILAAARAAWGEDSDRYGTLALITATGARAGEIIGLRPSDIRQIRRDGKLEWCVDINEEPDATPRKGFDRTVKTDVSPRLIPLHPAVERVVLAAKGRNGAAFRLFDTLTGETHDDRVKRFGTSFTRLLRYQPQKDGEKTGESLIDRLVEASREDGARQDADKLSVQSLRHTFADTCAKAWGGKDTAEQLAIMGKSESRYGSTIKDLKATMAYRAKYFELPVLGTAAPEAK